MNIKSSTISANDLFGIILLKKKNGIKFDNYYDTIFELRSLLFEQVWNDSVTRYYINVSGNFDTVRLSYFTLNPQKVSKCLNDFLLKKSTIELIETQHPQMKLISTSYGGEELRFRKYLYRYTLIGLDLLSADLLNARCLFATFRWQVMRSRQEYKTHFEGTFIKHSKVYSSLSEEDKEQFWNDLSYWPNPPQVDWAHMMVNMILPGDFNADWNAFLLPQPALTNEEINEIIKSMNFQVTVGWEPIKV